MGKSKGPSGPQKVEQTSSNIPEFAKPFYQELMGRTMYETTRPYEAYTESRLAEFDPYETAAMEGMADMAAMGDPAEIGLASRYAQKAGSFTPGQVYSGYTAGDISPGYSAGNISNQYQAGQRGVGYQPGQFDPGYQAGTMDIGYQPTNYQSGYQAGQFDPNYQAGDISRQYAGPTFEAGTSTDPAQIQDYMNPYTQLVTDVQKREARKQSDISGSNIAQQAAQSGGLGGYREAIMQSEREGDLSQQLQDIQATGDQAAYQQAMQAMEGDRAARLQEAQFGTSVRGQDIQAFQAGEQARQQAAQMGLNAQQQEEAARQAQESARLSGSQFQESTQARLQDFQNQKFQAEEQARQQAAQMGLSAQEMEDRAKQAGENFQQQQFSQNEQLRQFQQQENRAVFEAQERARQEGARLGLNAQEIQERVNQAQNEARMRSQEFNVQSSRDAAGLGLDAARFLGGLGGQRQDMGYDRLQNLQAAGQIRRDLGQRGMDIGYQDFLRQQAFPREQLALLNAMLQGLPIQPGTTTSSFGTGPSDMQQMLGTGIGGVGLYNAMRGGR
tara:strand:+ start:8724 stop:10394 length:1671 start_codon:yes stop_codon:yes gene_type:complete